MSSDIYTNLHIRKTRHSDTVRIGDATVSPSVSGDDESSQPVPLVMIPTPRRRNQFHCVDPLSVRNQFHLRVEVDIRESNGNNIMLPRDPLC